MQRPSPTGVAGAQLFLSLFVVFRPPLPAPLLIPTPGTGAGVGQGRHLGEGGELGKEVLRASAWERQTSPSEMHILLSSQVREKERSSQAGEEEGNTLNLCGELSHSFLA